MNPWKGLKGLPRDLWMVSIATLINRSGSMVLPFLVVYLNKELHYSITDAGLVLTIYGVAALLTAPFVGKLCDSVEPFKIMKASLLTSGLLLFLFPFLKEYYQIASLTFIWSVTNEAFRPANLTLISELSSVDQRRMAYALNRLVTNIGMSIGPAIGGFLSLIDFSLIFYVDGAFHIISFLFLTLINLPAIDELKTRIHSKVKKTEKGVFSENRHLFYFLFSIVPVQLVFFQMMSTMPLFLIKELGYSESTYGMLFTINTLLIILLEVPLLNYLSKVSNARLVIVGSILTAIGFGGTLFAASTPILVVTVIIWTFGEMIIFPSSTAYVSEVAPENRKGQFMGFYQTSFNVSFTVGPWLGTITYENSGASVLWGGALILGLISALSIYILKKRKQLFI